MAPLTPDLKATQENIKNVITDLYTVLSLAANYDTISPSTVSTRNNAHHSTREALIHDFDLLAESLRETHRTASSTPLSASQGIPEPLIQYVENGRNPDIYTREFVELVRRMNQLMRGKMHAFGEFRDLLAREMTVALPELKEDVKKVVVETGGRWPLPEEEGEGNEGKEGQQ